MLGNLTSSHVKIRQGGKIINYPGFFMIFGKIINFYIPIHYIFVEKQTEYNLIFIKISGLRYPLRKLYAKYL